MKVLMFGWEFPPHISGGLGTACYGLTKALISQENMDIIFVIPKTFGDEEPSDEDDVDMLKKTGSLIEMHKRNLGFTLLGAALLHFLFPGAVLL